MNGTYVITEYEEKIMGFLLDEKKLVSAEYFSEDDLLYNIYSAKVIDYVPSIGAAFLDAGLSDTLYYPLKENEDKHLYIKHGKKDSLRPGDEILIQVSKSPIKTKKAEASSDISFTGNYVVINRSGRINISKKIHDKDKVNKLKEELLKLLPEENIYNSGIILRTAAQEADIDAVISEANLLLKHQMEVIKKGLNSVPFKLIDSSSENHISFVKNLIIRKCYDEFTVITDRADILKDLKAGIDVGPVNIKFYSDDMVSLLNLYGIEDKLSKAMARKVYLKSGGYLIIDPTEALTVIDVNSGKSQGGKKDKDEYLLKLNKEAFDKILDTIKLRNISGIIIVDFMNIKDKDKYLEMISYIKTNAKKDNLLTYVDMTSLGLCELTRKKTKKPLAEIL